MKTKKCSKCGITKSISEFSKDKSRKDNLQLCCKQCQNEYRKHNKKKIKQYKKEYHINNKEILSLKLKNFYELNKEEILIRTKKYQDNNKEIIRQKSKEHYLKNKEKIKQRNKNYRDKNIEKVKKSKKRYQDRTKEKRNLQLKKRKQTDVNFKISCDLRTRIWQALKKNQKSTRTLELLGCSIEFLKQHLQSQFQEGMDWNNHGKYGWHVDHQVPCASFDLSKSSEQKLCFNYSNLQPLWAIDNLKKGSKY